MSGFFLCLIDKPTFYGYIFIKHITKKLKYYE
jgi:hypothetical protein